MKLNYSELLDYVNKLHSVLTAVHDEIRPGSRPHSSDSYLPPHLQDAISEAIKDLNLEKQDLPSLEEHIDLTIEVQGDNITSSILRFSRESGSDARVVGYAPQDDPKEKYLEFLNMAFNQAFHDSVTSVLEFIGGEDE